MRSRSPWALLVLLFVVGCGRSAPPTPSPSAGTPETITGRERLGWDQRAGDATELASFRYAIYVDGTRSEVNEVRCGGTASANEFPCDGRLPALTAGIHTLELAAYTVDGATLESARSLPFRVSVTGVITSATWPIETPEVTADGTRLLIERLADGLEEPTDAVFAPDGRIFIAERRGRIRVVEDGRLQTAPALIVDDVVAESRAGVMGIAVEPQFEHTHFVFLLHTVPSVSGELAFRLARYRELRGTLAERAVIFDGVPASDDRTASLRFGPDGLLYVAVRGRVLRLNADGSTPRDQAGASPVFMSGIGAPGGLAWDPRSGLLWLAEELGTVEERRSRLTVIGTLPGQPIRAAARARQPLVSSAAAIAFLTGDLIPSWKNDLLIASEAGRHILRMRVDPTDAARPAATERLLQDRVGGVRVVLAGPDGAIYFLTADALGRLRPVRSPTSGV